MTRKCHSRGKWPGEMRFVTMAWLHRFCFNRKRGRNGRKRRRIGTREAETCYAIDRMTVMALPREINRTSKNDWPSLIPLLRVWRVSTKNQLTKLRGRLWKIVSGLIRVAVSAWNREVVTRVESRLRFRRSETYRQGREMREQHTNRTNGIHMRRRQRMFVEQRRENTRRFPFRLVSEARVTF